MSATGRVWNYLLGYVIIELKGRGVEHFINGSTARGIPLWNVKRMPESCTAATSMEGFLSMRDAVRGTGLHVRIMKKRGFPMLLSQFRQRGALLFGWIAVLMALIALSRFVWVIDITGCDAVREEDVLALLERNGVKRGTAKATIETFPLGTLIMHSDERIAWAGARLEGTVLRVSIVEADGYGMISDEPGNVYAVCDGVIESITVRAGKPEVVAGQAVKKGQLLISGTLGEAGAEQTLVRARGEVLATVAYVAEGTAADAAEAGAGAAGGRIAIEADGLFSIGGAAEGETEAQRAELSGLFLPIEYIMVVRDGGGTVALSKKDRALLIANKRLEALLPRDMTLVSKESELIENADGSITARITVYAERNIGITRGFNE